MTMDTIERLQQATASNADVHLCGAGPAVSRRAVVTAAAASAAAGAAGTAAGWSAVSADTIPAMLYGAPLVELHVPAGVLTLAQKGAMIKGIADVLIRATKLPPDQAKKLWVQIFETAEGGWGLGGDVFVPSGK
jgi:phenylpyruvate tautomerase PptA (4-oxalocrotonate tautomerase family)